MIIQKTFTNQMGVKIFIVSWILFMDTIPEIRIFNVLPDFLPRLFSMLSDKQQEVNIAAERCLKEFLRELTYQFENLSYEIEYKILEILIDQSKINHDSTRLTAFEWIHTFLYKYNDLVMNKPQRSSFIDLKFNSDNYYYKTTDMFENEPNDKDNLFETINDGNNEIYGEDQLMNIPFNLFPKILEIVLLSVNNNNEKISTFVTNNLI